MTDYNKSVNFAVKDTLTSGDPNKIVSGAEIDTEFNNIASSSGTKADKVSAATANNFAGLNASGNLIDSGKSSSDFADSSDTENRLSTLETDIDSKANKVTSATEDNFASLDSNGDIKDSGESSTTIINISSPTGAITAFATNNAPAGWLECNGAAVSRSTYANLFSVIGTSFGVGDGTNTFNLPDLRGEFIRGWDNTRGVDSGRAFGKAQSEDVKSHDHPNGIIENQSDVTKSFVYGETSQDVPGLANGQVAQGSGVGNVQGLTGSHGGSETRPRNIALMYIIKT